MRQRRMQPVDDADIDLPGWGGTVMGWLRVATQLVTLNILWWLGLLAGLVVCGALPAGCAVHELSRRSRRDPSMHLWRDFWRIYRGPSGPRRAWARRWSPRSCWAPQTWSSCGTPAARWWHCWYPSSSSAACAWWWRATPSRCWEPPGASGRGRRYGGQRGSLWPHHSRPLPWWSRPRPPGRWPGAGRCWRSWLG
ncbi:hypothetical protein CWT12_10695 [Actinomyces sp. 432]|nr:hypothetical protein CWT12_10695 [Actinomyces sp. 432]